MARVIRGARVVPLAVWEAKDEAARIVEAAHERAARLRDERMAELKEEARQLARAELAAAHLEVERARQDVLSEGERSVATLALAVAQRLVLDELDARPERVQAIVRDALDRVRRASRVRVRAHPDDAAQLMDLEVEIVADASIERGGCVVESELGVVDARIETRIDALARALSGARRP